MWTDALLTLKARAEIEEARRGPRAGARRTRTKNQRGDQDDRAASLIASTGPSSSAPAGKPSSTSSPTATGGHPGGGAGSRIDSRPGGRMLIRHPNAVEASGEVMEVVPPERIVFTYGYQSGPASPPGSSRVTITLDQCAQGTQLRLTHELPRRRGARRARTGMALPARRLRQCGRRCGARGRRGDCRPLVGRLVRAGQGQARRRHDGADGR